MNDQEIDEILRQAAQAPPELEPELLRRIVGSIGSSLRPVRPLPPAWMLTAGLVLICAAVAIAGAAHAGFYGIEKMDLVKRALIFSALAVFAWVTGIGFVHEMVPGSRRRISPGALLVMVSVLLVAVFAPLFRDYQIIQFLSSGIACLLTGLLFALPAGLLGWLLLRRGFAVNPVSAGLVAGMLGGLAGLGMLELHCQNFEAAHVLVWHIAVVPVSGAVGASLAWMLRLRAGSGD